MRSRQLDLERYNTDKITNQYLARYDPFLAPYLDQPLKLLELGIYRGGSLRLWRDYFPRGLVVGIDAVVDPAVTSEDRVRVFQGLQQDTEFLTRVAQETAPDGFDVIIDDASHLGDLTRIAFWHLFTHHLKPGGLYVVEDWGTGYWSDWPDGQTYRSQAPRWARLLHRLGFPRRMPTHTHSSGMVGFVKELVDEQGMHDLSRGSLHGQPKRSSLLESVTVTPSIVFVRKPAAPSVRAA